MTARSKRKKTAKKRSRVRRESTFDLAEYRVAKMRGRLGISKMPNSETSMSRLENAREQIEAADKLMLEDKRKDIQRRRKLFKALERFEAILKEKLGRQISVKFHMSDDDEIHVMTYFKPKRSKGTVVQHPFAADPLIKEAAEKSGLSKCMGHAGTGTMLDATMMRDNHFIETKWSPKGLSMHTVSKRAAKRARR